MGYNEKKIVYSKMAEEMYALGDASDILHSASIFIEKAKCNENKTRGLTAAQAILGFGELLVNSVDVMDELIIMTTSFLTNVARDFQDADEMLSAEILK